MFHFHVDPTFVYSFIQHHVLSCATVLGVVGDEKGRALSPYYLAER